MFCPHCGHKIQLDDQKFCDGCGFDLSKVETSKPTELKKMIDFALEDHSKPPTPPKSTVASAARSQTSGDSLVKPARTSWWKNLNKSQIVILIIGGFFTLSMLVVWQTFSPAGIDGAAIIFLLIMIVLITLLVAWKEKTWGWGWYILAGLTFKGMEKVYTTYGLYNSALRLLTVVAAIFVYFVLRNKYLKRVKILWRRSLYSGIIAFVVAAFFTPIVAYFVPTQDQRIAQKMKEANQVLDDLKSFHEQDLQLWSKFISEPKSEIEYRANLEIVESSIPLYHRKDSLLLAGMTKIQRDMKEIYEETIPHGWSLPYTPTDFQQIVDKTKDISRLDQLMLVNLATYYKCLLSADVNQFKYLQAYQGAQSNLASAQPEYAVLLNRFFKFDQPKKSTE